MNEPQANTNAELSVEAKNKGKESYMKGDFDEAIVHYTEAIKVNPNDAELYSNRAACFLKVTLYRCCISDCEECIRLDPTFVKSYLRKGLSCLMLQQIDRAKSAYEKALGIDPNNKEARAYLKDGMMIDADTGRIFQRASSAKAMNFEIMDLQDDMLIEIFKYLSPYQRVRAEEVCKRWRTLSRHAWTNFRVLDESHFFPDPSMTEFSLAVVAENVNMLRTLLQRCGSYLTVLDFSDCVAEELKPKRNDGMLSVVAQYCPNLESVSFGGYLFASLALRAFADHCSNLTSICLYGCFQNEYADITLCYFFSKCPRLTSVNLGGNKKINGACLWCLPIQLKCLLLYKCISLEDDAIEAISRFLSLEVLSLPVCHITRESLERAFQVLANLRILGLHRFKDMPVWSSIMSKLNKLKELDLGFNRNFVDDNALDDISRACSSLEKLYMDYAQITDNGLGYLDRLHRLIELHLTGCKNVTDVGVKVLANLRLEVLRLNKCTDITDNSMTDLARSCLRLTQLSLRSCNKITDATIWCFFDSLDERMIMLKLDVVGTSVSAEVCALVDHPLLAVIF